jgi:pimeloyl-ACP methyl ester carboxylesterase
MEFLDSRIAVICLDAYRTDKQAIILGYDFFEDRTTDTQFIVKKTDNHIIIAFRGTESVQDAINNLKYQTRDIGGVHSGFAENFASVRADLDKILDNRKDREVIFCGHSLGGALAVIAYGTYSQLNISCRCVTFGAPRVFGAEAASTEGSPAHGIDKSKITRYIHSRDPVTYLPPWVMGYRHVGRKVKLKLLQPDPEGKCGLLSFFKSVASRHSMKRYVENIKGR